MKMSNRHENDPAAALDRMCQTLARTETPFDELGRARAEARLRAALVADQAARPGRKRMTIAALALGAIAASLVAVITFRTRPTASTVAADGPALFDPY